MEVLLLIGAIQSCFFAILVLSKKRKSIADKILALWLAIFTLHLAFVYYSFQSGYEFYIEYGHIPSGLLVVYYSLMYMYTESLTSKENVFKAKWLLHIIPTAITYICIIPLAQLPYEEKVRLATHLTTDSYAIFVFGITMLFTTIYLVATLRLLKRHKISIRKMFSYEENISLNWLRILAILLVFLWVGISSLVINAHYYETTTLAMQPKDHMIQDMQGTAVFVIFIFLLGFFGIRQQAIYSIQIPKKETTVMSSTKSASNRYEKSGLKKEDSETHLKRLLKYMEKEKPYLNEKLLLKEVAEKMDISTNYLSQVINENLEKNFFDFVNSYRVDLAKQKLIDPSYKNYTILSLAYDCGFSSKSSFNSIFKKFVGLTPSEFRNKI
ncbi:MAG: helix-turn-helix domain-containing protein [Paludibacter sp.]|nr:helix-turn-helix domain-containing protein [Paludibacter sp.]MDD4198697.1 helix-turn-helix domain-containing protein [Paludibacter sp.]MDD4427115.1 helix-turn-helix domain-containing protein [Paludibacter sp.]